ncbi:Golgi phosphoprotein 3-domain-containing protein [Pyronema omphalodes]|nr:Golgi phosphoprotein 3-domain-containing protein [Pyronema omphalodes]
MASTGGLTRRRGGGGGGGDEDGERSSSPAASRPRSGIGGGEVNYTTSENGHKIAYDPKDISQNAEMKKMPKLTLMEEILLLGLKDKQGYLSFWNENISYALRGCIILELALRKRISVTKDSSRSRYPLADRLVEVVDDTLTGEVLLDEALKMMKQEKMSISDWIDLMSGETWNLFKMGYQLKQVRERLAKGLVDKGILRTEKRNFLLFDMATHPVADGGAKDEIRKRVRDTFTQSVLQLNANLFNPEGMEFRYIRTIAMVCAAYAANVLDNVMNYQSQSDQENITAIVNELLNDFGQWPFAIKGRRNDDRIGGKIGSNIPAEIINEIGDNKTNELHLEVVAAVLSVFTGLGTQ